VDAHCLAAHTWTTFVKRDGSGDAEGREMWGEGCSSLGQKGRIEKINDYLMKGIGNSHPET